MKKIILFATILCSFKLSAQELAPVNVTVQNFDEEPIPGAQIHFFDTKSDKTFYGIADAQGKFIVNLEAGMYEIQLKSIGDVKDYNAIEIPKLGEGEMYGDVQMIIQYEEETSFTLSNLHFETGKSIIKTSSYSELDELVKYLELKPDLKIEVAGYTDSDGSDQSNLNLSQDRSDAVKKYLISKGIDASRIISKGYGETNPVADNNSASGKGLNRRTEIHILN